MTDLTCSNCGEPRGAEDVFCENCGFDFLGGSLPEAEIAEPETLESETAEPETAEETTEVDTAEVPNANSLNPDGSATLHVSIEVDRAQFDKVVQEGEVTFPSPVPASKTLKLTGTEFHIGRTSRSRKIYPDLDIFELTGDEAVSGRHAMVSVDREGAYSITDLGSTNGTTVEAVEKDLLVKGTETPLKIGSAVFVGAWSKLTILDPEAE